jgi:hypothetical protein
MAKSFSVEISMNEEPAQAQALAASKLSDAARRVGLRLAAQSPGELCYRPRVQWPFLVMLWHRLNGEGMTVTFADRPDGGSRVRISGAVSGASVELASDPEHWSEALGAAPPA